MVLVKFQWQVLRHIGGNFHVVEVRTVVLASNGRERASIHFREFFEPLKFAFLAAEPAGGANELMTGWAECFPAENQWGLPAFA